MKIKTLLIISALVFVSQLFSQDIGKVSIRNGGNYPKFIASLNGIRLGNDYVSQVNFDFLDETHYRVKLLQAGSRNVLNFVVNSAPNYVSKYVLTKDAYGNYSMILESKSLMSGETEVPSNIVVTTPPATVTSPPVTTVVVNHGPQAMPDTDYNDMVKAVKKESLESTRMEMAKTFFGNQNLSSAQVLGIVRVFSLESSRLTFAKFAYSRVIDKAAYFKVYDGFNLSSSKRDMSDYIKNNP